MYAADLSSSALVRLPMCAAVRRRSDCPAADVVVTSPPDAADYAAALAERCATTEPYPDGRFNGDGIVVCAGGASIFTNAYVLIHVLRHVLHCSLPIEVWHFGDAEMSARMRLILRGLDADPVDANTVMLERNIEIDDGWQLKSFAMAECRFKRVLLLDADIVPERDPSEIFAWPQFEASGAVLWPDICSIVPENKIWAACGLPPRMTRAVESGQVAIDKSRHWAALQIIVFLNRQAAYYYRLVYGDKDLFLIGFLLAARPYHLVPHVPSTDQPLCLYQRDFDGERLFQHRTGAKWRYAGPQMELAGFRRLDECKAALTALRSTWNGHIFNAPPRSASAKAEEARLVLVPTVALASPGAKSVALDLLEEGEIGGGHGQDACNWYCAGEDEIELVGCDQFGETMRFRKGSLGRWREVNVPVFSARSLLESDVAPSSKQPMPSLRSAWESEGRYMFGEKD